MRVARAAVWPYLVLGVALLGAIGFGWFQTQQANQLALETENKYLSAFHKVKWTSENIEERMSLLMASNDLQQQTNLLSDLRVYSAQAVEHMAVLPFLTLETPRIQHFLNTLRTRSDELHYKLSNGDLLTPQDWNELQELRQQSVFFEGELGQVLGLVGNNMLRWRNTVRATSPAETGAATTPITQSVLELDTALQAPPGEEQALSPDAGPLPAPRTDPGPKVDQATAMQAVREFVDIPLADDPQPTGVADPEDQLGELSLYFFQAQKENGLILNFGVSQHGGHVIYMLDGRLVKDKRMTKDQLIERAREMLKRRGYDDLQYVSATENDGTLVMEFAPRQNGIAIHVDMIRIMLAMDDGELVGFDARSFWTNRYERELAKPLIDATQVQGKVSPRLMVKEAPSLAVIADRRSQERQVWEVRGSIDDQHYRIFVDVMTGQEVDLLRVAGDPAPPISAGQ